MAEPISLADWAVKWGIPPQALRELCDSALYFSDEDSPNPKRRSEAYVQSEIRLESARKQKYLFRNNRGAGKLASGNFVRYGLANDSKKLGDVIKSADLVGLEKILITPEMVGTIIGRFLSVEVKHENWKYSGTIEENAQIAWATLINAQGGRAVITTRAGLL